MSIDPTKTPARFINVVHQFLSELKRDPNIIWSQCDIPIDCIYDESSLVPLDSFLKSLRLMEQYQQTDEPLSHIVRRLFPLTFMGRFGHTLLSAPSVEKGLNLFFRFFQQASPLMLTKTPDNTGGFYIHVKGCEIFCEFEQCMLEVALMKIQDYVLFCSGNPNGTCLNLVRDEKNIKLQKWSKTPVRFNGSENSLFIDKSVLSLHSPTSDANLYNINIKRFETYKNQLDFNVTVTTQVRNIITLEIEKGLKPSLVDVSDRLLCSDRKLSRSLKGENETFQKILDECIAQRAKFLVLNGHTIKSIAYDLGFNSVVGLNKSFHRYYGMSLKEYQSDTEFILTFYKRGL